MSDDRLTLAVVVNLYPPYVVGGNEVLARDVVGGLRARGHTVHVLTGHGRELPRDGFTHPVLGLDLDRKDDFFLGARPLTARGAIDRHLYDHHSYGGVRRALEMLRPDLAVAWNLYGASMAPLVAARRWGGPVVAQPADKWLLHGLYDGGPSLANGNGGIRLAAALARPALRRLARPDYVLAVSEFIRSLHVHAGYPAERSAATYLGVPVSLFPMRDAPPARGRGWRRLMFAGQLWEGKGPQVAVEAMRLLKACRGAPTFHLDVFGAGTDGFVAHLRRLIAEGDLEDRVTLRGLVPRSHLAWELREHDAYLFCSTWDEPFSAGLLEAMCAGLPCIATATGGTPEAITDGTNGLLVAPGQPQQLAEAVLRLARAPDLCRGLGARAAADVRRRWGFDAYIDRLEDAYRGIVEAHRSGRAARLPGPAA
jgi:glycosyltransferase involved in cell wall biosynthesis